MPSPTPPHAPTWPAPWTASARITSPSSSREDYKALEETAYLLRSPENAKRLLSAVDALGKGKGKERQLSK